MGPKILVWIFILEDFFGSWFTVGSIHNPEACNTVFVPRKQYPLLNHLIAPLQLRLASLGGYEERILEIWVRISTLNFCSSCSLRFVWFLNFSPPLSFPSENPLPEAGSSPQVFFQSCQGLEWDFVGNAPHPHPYPPNCYPNFQTLVLPGFIEVWLKDRRS